MRRSLQEATRAGEEAIAGRVHRALATECVYSGRPLDEAIAHGREATTLLERAEDQFWFSQALFTLAYCCIFAGEFDAVLAAALRLGEFGDATGNRRAKANASMIAGFCRALRGEGESGIELCERARAVSPDDFETAFILACLGRAHWEAGDIVRAVLVLEEAVQLADHVRSLQFRAWFRTMLSEAYFLNGKLDQAAATAAEALEASMKVQFLLGVGLSRQIQGRIAMARNDLVEAERNLNEAMDIFTEVGARFELARTRLELAAIAHTQGNGKVAGAYLEGARALFAALGIPKYINRTVQLSKQLDIVLPG